MCGTFDILDTLNCLLLLLLLLLLILLLLLLLLSLSLSLSLSSSSSSSFLILLLSRHWVLYGQLVSSSISKQVECILKYFSMYRNADFPSCSRQSQTNTGRSRVMGKLRLVIADRIRAICSLFVTTRPFQIF